MSLDNATQQFGKAVAMSEVIGYEFGVKEQTRWGFWEVVTEPKKDADGTVIECQKHITVNAGASLSLQVHKGRGETYIGLEGTTHVCINDEVFELREGDGLYIPRGALHFSWNEGDIPSKFHEIQSGPLCDEADIKRSADKYKLAHELDGDEEVVQMMIEVAKDRYDNDEIATHNYNSSNPHTERIADLDLLNIYMTYKDDMQTLTLKMDGILKKSIQLHHDNTPNPKRQPKKVCAVK